MTIETHSQLIAKVEQALERLHEYRTALITAAATGKIHVRQPTSKEEKKAVPAHA